MISGATGLAARVISYCSPASRKLHQITNISMSTSNIEGTYYCNVGQKSDILKMVELLIESVRSQMFLDSDVHQQIEIVKEEHVSPFSMWLHQAAYRGAYENPDYPETFPGCFSQVLKNFVTEHYTAPRMILSAYGVEHSDILSVAKPLLLDLPGGPLPPEPMCVYTGGDLRYSIRCRKHMLCLPLKFLCCWHKMMGHRSDVTLNILKELLGGMADDWDLQKKNCSDLPNYSRSRLCVRILKKYPQVHKVSAISFIHHDTGLFGIELFTDSDFASKAIDLVANEFLEIATPGKVSQAELDCAKQSMEEYLVLKGLEADMINQSMMIVEELSRFGERITMEQKLKAIDEVTLTDIESLAGKLLSSPLAMLSIGNDKILKNIPCYDSVSRKFHAN